MLNVLHRCYRALMARETVNFIAWKSAYAGKWARWCNQHRSKNLFDHPRDLHAHVMEMQMLRGPLNYLEFGVHKGESIVWWLAKNKHPESRFVGFDSFRGLPVDWRAGFPKGHFATNGKTPDIQDERCSFEVGWFHETLPRFVRQFSSENPTVINLDADLYGSTLLVLCLLVGTLKKNDVVILDDFSDSLHVFRAFLDFVSSYPVEYDLVAQHPRYNRIAVQIRDLPTPT